MAERPDLAGMWRGAVAANLRYYEAWGRIVTDWVRDLASVGLGPQTTAVAVTEAPGLPAAGAARSEPHGAQRPAAALVLEASSGEVAAGAFLVENQLGRAVETPLICDEITDPEGLVLPVSLQFDPATVSLAPQEQCVVRVRLTVTDALNPDSDYRTVIRGPDLPGTSVPVVLRRVEPEA